MPAEVVRRDPGQSDCLQKSLDPHNFPRGIRLFSYFSQPRTTFQLAVCTQDTYNKSTEVEQNSPHSFSALTFQCGMWHFVVFEINLRGCPRFIFVAWNRQLTHNEFVDVSFCVIYHLLLAFAINSFSMSYQGKRRDYAELTKTCIHPNNLKQNEAQSARVESTHKGVN